MIFSRDVLIATIGYAAVALVLTQVPLFHSLGYESSFVMALVVSVVAGPAAIRRIRFVYAETELSDDLAAVGTLRAARRAFPAMILPLAAPFVLLLGNAAFVKNCAIGEGIGFFLLLPVVTAVFATSLAFFCAVHYARPRLVYFLLMALSLVYAGALGYWTPAVFSYNFFYGYFPGFTYDEGMRITQPLLSFRVATIGLAGVLLWLGYLLVINTNRSMSVRQKGLALLRAMAGPGQRVFSLSVLALGVILVVFRCELGYEADASFIRGRLGGEYDTEHFAIYYPAGLYSADDLRRIADEHEFRFAQLVAALQTKNPGRIESYIYPSASVKKQLIGAGSTNIAKPWLHQVHITAQSLQATLRHELTHVVAGAYGVPVVHASPRMGLTEGLPMALEAVYGSRSLHTYAAAMMQQGIAPDITGLMSSWGFAVQSPSVSYVLAGSFCRFLIDRYGIGKLMIMYGNADWKEQYGRPLSLLIADWKAYLGDEEVTPEDLKATDVLFRDPALIFKQCPRFVGETNGDASRMFAAGEYAKAESLYALAYDNGHGLESLSGLAMAALRLGAYDTVTAVIGRAEESDPHPARYLPLAVARGDAYWGKGDRQSALRCYAALRIVDLTDAYTEASGVRFLAVQDDSLQQLYARYFLSTGPDSVRAQFLDSLMRKTGPSPLLLYLRGRMALKMGAYDEAIALLSSCSFADIDRVLETLRIQSIGIALYQQGKYDRARVVLWESLNADDGEATEQGVYDWIERCDWKRGGGGR